MNKKQLEKKLKKLDAEKERLDDELRKIVWKEIEPYTHSLKDLLKCYPILNNTYQTPNMMDIWSNLRKIKNELENTK